MLRAKVGNVFFASAAKLIANVCCLLLPGHMLSPQPPIHFAVILQYIHKQALLLLLLLSIYHGKVSGIYVCARAPSQ